MYPKSRFALFFGNRGPLPDLKTYNRYQPRFEHYQRLWPLVADYVMKPPP